jgi:hypothetical protein
MALFMARTPVGSGAGAVACRFALSVSAVSGFVPE